MAPPKKQDLYKMHRGEYVATRRPALVVTKPAKYLAVTGTGAPASPEFQDKVSALYTVAFAIKKAKKFMGQDYRLWHLEGLWSAGEGNFHLVAEPPSAWNWKLLMRVPDFITLADVKSAIKSLAQKGRAPSSAVQIESLNEGTCVQMLHVGPYATEEETIAQMMAFVREQRLALRGLHHEIYLSDPRRVRPERLRTILRHPVTRAR